MMGDKIRLLMQDMPSPMYTLEVHPDGVVAVRYYDSKKQIRGRFEFSSDSDMEFIHSTLNALGFAGEKHGE